MCPCHFLIHSVCRRKFALVLNTFKALSRGGSTAVLIVFVSDKTVLLWGSQCTQSYVQSHVCQSSGCSPVLITPFSMKMYHYLPVSIKSRGNILQFSQCSSIPSLLSGYLPTKLAVNATGKEQVFEEGRSEIEPQTAPVCLTLFNEAPAVRHGGLNPPHSNICLLKYFDTGVGQPHQAKTD